MTVPLGVLSVLSIIGGYVGIPYVFWGGFNKIGEFLAPVVGGHGDMAKGQAVLSLQKLAYAAEGGGAGATQGVHHPSMELILMGISIVIALTGIFIAYVFYIKRPDLPALLTFQLFWLKRGKPFTPYWSINTSWTRSTGSASSIPSRRWGQVFGRALMTRSSMEQ
jgi:NADH:ubiquinone oxidoreductase subunit 5 (subunit L)/multisubunit Na+/H+ antiporter MnhA subunit